MERFAANRPGRDLFAELETIRRTGYSVVHDELSPGASALSVPVRKGTQTVAAVWVGGPTERLARHEEGELRARIEVTANNISRSLSASWPEIELMWNARS